MRKKLYLNIPLDKLHLKKPKEQSTQRCLISFLDVFIIKHSKNAPTGFAMSVSPQITPREPLNFNCILHLTVLLKFYKL